MVHLGGGLVLHSIFDLCSQVHLYFHLYLIFICTLSYLPYICWSAVLINKQDINNVDIVETNSYVHRV